MKHGTALAIKFVLTSAIYATALPLLGRTLLTHALLLAGATTLFLWLLGDLVILPRFGNAAATAVDGGLALLLLPVLGKQIGSLLMPPSVLVAAGALAVSEWCFHVWVERNGMID